MKAAIGTYVFITVRKGNRKVALLLFDHLITQKVNEKKLVLCLLAVAVFFCDLLYTYT
jgi:hypothetical protein